MRASTFLSIAIALVLAVAAVFGTQTYLDSQRQQMEQSARVSVTSHKTLSLLPAMRCALASGSQPKSWN